MSCDVAKIPKPNMRGLMEKRIALHLGLTGIAVTITAICWRVFRYSARKQRYAHFHETYDPEASFERMKAKGVFDSIPK